MTHADSQTKWHLDDRQLQRLVEIRHDLHAHPEVGYEEHRTSKAIQAELTDAGVEHVAGLAGGTGVLAWIPGTSTGPAIGLRADIDALPIEEATGLPWASTHPGQMHACGHDGHTTVLLGAARALAEEAAAGTLERPVVMVFQPAEEGGGGGERMVQDGCLDGRVAPFSVEKMFGLHGWPGLDAGIVGTKDGPLLAASDRFEIIIEGEGCHAAWPHSGRDPIVAAAATVAGLQTIVSRNVDPLDAAVVSVTVLESGSAFNVIPMSARLGGTARSLRAEIQDLIEARITAVAESIASAHDCKATVRYTRGYPVTENHPDATNRFREIARAEVGADRLVEIDRPAMGGEDFAYYGQVVPACFFLLGQRPTGEATMPELHSPRYDFNDSTIETGVRLFRRLAMEA